MLQRGSSSLGLFYDLPSLPQSTNHCSICEEVTCQFGYGEEVGVFKYELSGLHAEDRFVYYCISGVKNMVFNESLS